MALASQQLASLPINRVTNVQVNGHATLPQARAHVMRGAAALLSTKPLTSAASLLAAILLPRYLGDQGLGNYAVATTLAGMAATIGALGIPSILVRDIANDSSSSEKDGPAALLLVMLTGVVICAIVGLVLPMFGIGEAERRLTVLALVGTVATLGNVVLVAVLNGKAHHAKQAWLNAIGTAGGTFAGLSVLAAGGGAEGFLVASATITMASVLVGWRACGFRLQRSAAALSVWLKLARRGSPFLAWAVAMQIRNQIDIVLVAGILGADAAGWLAAAYRIVFIPAFLPVVITTPLFPLLSRLASDQPAFGRAVRQGFKGVLVLTVPAIAMIMALAPVIPSLLHWDPAFLHSVPLMMLLAIDQPLAAIDILLGSALMALRCERRWLVVGLAAAAFNPLANLLLLPLSRGWTDNGAMVACAVEVITELVMMGGALVLLPSGVIGREQAKLVGCLAIAGTALVVVARTLLPASLLLAVAVGGLAFVVVALALKVVTRDELRVMYSALGRVVPRGASWNRVGESLPGGLR